MCLHGPEHAMHRGSKDVTVTVGYGIFTLLPTTPVALSAMRTTMPIRTSASRLMRHLQAGRNHYVEQALVSAFHLSMTVTSNAGMALVVVGGDLLFSSMHAA